MAVLTPARGSKRRATTGIIIRIGWLLPGTRMPVG